MLSSRSLSRVRSIDPSLALTPHRYLLASLRSNVLVEDIELFTKKKCGRIRSEGARIQVMTLIGERCQLPCPHFDPELIMRVWYTL
jgi:hypothetical protein